MRRFSQTSKNLSSSCEKAKPKNTSSRRSCDMQTMRPRRRQKSRLMRPQAFDSNSKHSELQTPRCKRSCAQCEGKLNDALSPLRMRCAASVSMRHYKPNTQNAPIYSRPSKARCSPNKRSSKRRSRDATKRSSNSNKSCLPPRLAPQPQRRLQPPPPQPPAINETRRLSLNRRALKTRNKRR